MNRVIESIERRQLRNDLPQFKAGDTVRVHTQVFEGTVIKRQGAGIHESFTVRKQSFGVGVERTFPLHSPKIERIELTAIGDVSRAKLYYLREKVGKRARVRTKAGAVIAPPPTATPPPPAETGEAVAEAETTGDGDELAAGHAQAEAEAQGEPTAAGAEAAPPTEPE